MKIDQYKYSFYIGCGVGVDAEYIHNDSDSGENSSFYNLMSNERGLRWCTTLQRWVTGEGSGASSKFKIHNLQDCGCLC